jgi:hypothetical protein
MNYSVTDHEGNPLYRAPRYKGSHTQNNLIDLAYVILNYHNMYHHESAKRYIIWRGDSPFKILDIGYFGKKTYRRFRVPSHIYDHIYGEKNITLRQIFLGWLDENTES